MIFHFITNVIHSQPDDSEAPKPHLSTVPKILDLDEALLVATLHHCPFYLHRHSVLPGLFKQHLQYLAVSDGLD